MQNADADAHTNKSAQILVVLVVEGKIWEMETKSYVFYFQKFRKHPKIFVSQNVCVILFARPHFLVEV